MKRSEALRELERVVFETWGPKYTGRILRALAGQYQQGLTHPSKDICRWLISVSYACDKLAGSRDDDIK